MALVTRIDHRKLERDSIHKKAECTYDVIVDEKGRKLLQLDTYGSEDRQIQGKKSQSIRLSPEALAQLKVVLQKHNL
jgi:hypothetical protein